MLPHPYLSLTVYNTGSPIRTSPLQWILLAPCRI